MIWDPIPVQRAKKNKKFVFSALRKSARIRDFENAMEWLEKAGLILRCYRISTAKQPLSAYRQANIFKVNDHPHSGWLGFPALGREAKSTSVL